MSDTTNHYCRCNEPPEVMQNPDTKPPTPIDPADIRLGDVVRIVREVTVEQVAAKDGEAWLNLTWVASPGVTFLVHRPDPDAEARACAWAEYRKDYAPNPPALGAAHKAFLAGWQAAREQGGDVVRRAES